MTEQFVAKDTTRVQLDSLIAVMDALSYRIDTDNRVSLGFVTDNRGLKGNRNISLRTAVKIHNTPRKDWQKLTEGWYTLPIAGLDIAVTAYALNILYARKLVTHVKLVKSRKSPNRLKVESHMVKPANRAYIPLIGLEA